MTTRKRRDPYIVLGVTRQASGQEIARAYRRAARASHPDSGGAGSADRFRAVSDAYDLLRDPRRRAVYDRANPLVGPRARGAAGEAVRYGARGSQPLVLGRPAPSEPVQAQPSVGDFDEMVRLVLSLLRA